MTDNVAFSDWPSQRSQRTAMGVLEVRQVLMSKGIEAPIDEKHAHFYDPPLTVVEQRHRIHVRFDLTISGCRFCESEGGTTDGSG